MLTNRSRKNQATKKPSARKMAERTMRLRSSSRCSIRLMPGSSARWVTAARALPIASAGSTMMGYRLRGGLLLLRLFLRCFGFGGAGRRLGAGIGSQTGQPPAPARPSMAAECGDTVSSAGASFAAAIAPAGILDLSGIRTCDRSFAVHPRVPSRTELGAPDPAS